jgi:hypothetical protein
MGAVTKKQVDQLADPYIVLLLTRSKLSIAPADITPELIELKRQQVRMKRYLKRMKKTKKESDINGNDLLKG